MANTAHALHILVKHKEIAEDIIKQLGKGAKFQTLAKKSPPFLPDGHDEYFLAKV